MEFKSINNIFENRLFRIPDYQRGYAWRSDKEVVAFWNDLMNLPKGKSHFTGSLTLQKMSEGEINNLDANWLLKNDYTPWLVVDGQQRLTTITIFLQCIYEFLEELPFKDDFVFMEEQVEEFVKTIRKKFICREKRSDLITTYLLGYLNNSVSENYMQNYVFNDRRAIVNKESYYTLNIRNAKDFFKNSIQGLYQDNKNNIQVIEDLYKKVTQQLKFDLIEVGKDDDFNIFVAFETINNRGRQLSNLEKLKNRLIYLTTLYFETQSFKTPYSVPLRKTINGAWAKIYEQLGRNFKASSNGKVSVLDDDEFLRTHWILYYQYSRKTGNDYIDYLLEKKFTVQNVLKNLAKAESTQESLTDNEESDFDDVTVMDELSQEQSLTPEEIDKYVINLRETSEMWYYTWFPQDAKGLLDEKEIMWMERINRLGIAYFRPLITAILFKRLVTKNLSTEKSIELLKTIERFIFIVFRLQTTRSHYGSSEFNKAARELHKGIKTEDDILNMLDERISRSFDTEGYFNTQYMQTMVDKLFEQKDDERAGYYRWSAIRYFLYEYNAYLENFCHGLGKLEWDSFKQGDKDKISIEHIFPHKVEGYWAEQFKNVDKDKWSIYEGSLGNLLLLSQKINTKLQNDDFKTKKEGRESADESEKRIGYSNGSAAEREVSKKDDWTPEAIEETGLAMLKFMEDDKWGWGIKFKSEEEKKKLLLPGVY